MGPKQHKLTKRYIVGLRAVYKKVRTGDVKMVIVATDLEKVEEEHGIDEFLVELIQTCKKMKVPLVYCMSKKKLGCLARDPKQRASAIGIQNFQGANETYNELIAKTAAQREAFY